MLVRVCRRSLSWTVLAYFALCVVPTLQAQSVDLSSRVKMLRQGGYVVVMRHASSPSAPPAASQADPENVQQERQLDDAGRSSAQSMGQSLRRLGIPIGQVLVSPTYRAMQTARLARLPDPKAARELGDGGSSMEADKTGKRASWLKAKTAEVPASGTNTVLITHLPNIKEAFPQEASDLADGEALLFLPDGHGGTAFKGRVKIEDWAKVMNVKW